MTNELRSYYVNFKCFWVVSVMLKDLLPWKTVLLKEVVIFSVSKFLCFRGGLDDINKKR